MIHTHTHAHKHTHSHIYTHTHTHAHTQSQIEYQQIHNKTNRNLGAGALRKSLYVGVPPGRGLGGALPIIGATTQYRSAAGAHGAGCTSCCKDACIPNTHTHTHTNTHYKHAETLNKVAVRA